MKEKSAHTHSKDKIKSSHGFFYKLSRHGDKIFAAVLITILTLLTGWLALTNIKLHLLITERNTQAMTSKNGSAASGKNVALPQKNVSKDAFENNIYSNDEISLSFKYSKEYQLEEVAYSDLSDLGEHKNKITVNAKNISEKVPAVGNLGDPMTIEYIINTHSYSLDEILSVYEKNVSSPPVSAKISEASEVEVGGITGYRFTVNHGATFVPEVVTLVVTDFGIYKIQYPEASPYYSATKDLEREFLRVLSSFRFKGNP